MAGDTGQSAGAGAKTAALLEVERLMADVPGVRPVIQRRIA